MNNFWNELRKKGPILCLAPMVDVTDAAFRFIVAKKSKIPDTSSSLSTRKSLLAFRSARPVGLRKARSEEYQEFLNNFVTYTEFVSADGLVLAPEKGRGKLLKNLEYSEIERPIVAQLFTSKPEMMEKSAVLIRELGFDGVDINMGCPDKSIEKQGAGAALIKNSSLAREIIAAAKQGVKNSIPVSVKTRIGYNKDELETWLPELLKENPAAIILHARTRKEMSKVPAKWERIKRAVEIRDAIQTSPLTPLLGLGEGKHISTDDNSSSILFPSPDQREGRVRFRTLIIGNGDVKDVEDAYKKCQESGADGAMLGRAVFGNPWLFANLTFADLPIKKRMQVLLEHAKLFEEKFSGIKSFAIMKKHFREYLKDPDTRDLKFKLMRTENAKETEKLVNDFLVRYN